tara:strand:- start:182 stop:823 length:642 start_codon:yes stop_codon:yes gene_type:complete
MKFSIIITCFNREKFVARCIRSALSQRVVDRDQFEVIVIDDFSTDSSRKIIKEFDSIIKIINNKKNIGLSASRNKGIKSSRGKYILMLDSDDYISDFFLYFTGYFLDFNNDWDAAATDYNKVNTNGKRIKKYNCSVDPIACGILFRRKALLKNGLYNTKLKMLEDIELRNRFNKIFYTGRVAVPLYRYTMHRNNLTKNKELKKKSRILLSKIK